VLHALARAPKAVGAWVVAAIACASLLAFAPAAGAGTQLEHTPYGQLMTAHARMHLLANKASTSSVRDSADQVAAALLHADTSALWITAQTIDAPAYGTNVFSYSIAALTDLAHLPSGSVPGSAAVAKLVVGALRAVTASTISEAAGGNGKLLATANSELRSGEHRASKDPAAAARSYEHAWLHAFDALTGQISAAATGIPSADLTAAAENALGSKKIALAGPTMNLRKAKPLTSAGKPELFFGGAEGCPYCATQRWGMIAALSQFGSFSHLHLIQSDTLEAPIVDTFTFLGSSYSSPYISFVPVEILSNIRTGPAGYEHLQPATPAQKALIGRFDAGGITPFIDIGGRYIQDGSTVQPQLLGTYSWTQIARSLTNPSSVPAQVVAGQAEVMTAELCEVTGGKPQSVCSATVVQQYEAALPMLNGKGGGCPLTASDARSAGRPSRRGPDAQIARCGG
jgi:hypothetical protein